MLFPPCKYLKSAIPLWWQQSNVRSSDDEIFLLQKEVTEVNLPDNMILFKFYIDY